MVPIVLASSNKGKIEEIKYLLRNLPVQVKSASELGFNQTIEENGLTYQENALIKAKAISNLKHSICMADDSGLSVEALGGAPGVFSARYAGNNASDSENIRKLLSDLQGMNNRNAYFTTVIALIFNQEVHFFEGKIKGNITSSQMGSNGFGYDSVFIPEGNVKTFAQMETSEKNQYSHRFIAVNKMVNFLIRQLNASH